MEFSSSFPNCIKALKCSFDDIKKQCGLNKNELAQCTSIYEVLSKNDPDIEELPFGK
jgi:hypothetical protein